MQLRTHVAETGAQRRLRHLQGIRIRAAAEQSGGRLQDHVFQSVGPGAVLVIAEGGYFLQRHFKRSHQRLREGPQ